MLETWRNLGQEGQEDGCRYLIHYLMCLQGMNVSVGGLCSAFIYHSLTYVLTNINEIQLGPMGHMTSCNFSLISSYNDRPEMRLG